MAIAEVEMTYDLASMLSQAAQPDDDTMALLRRQLQQGGGASVDPSPASRLGYDAFDEADAFGIGDDSSDLNDIGDMLLRGEMFDRDPSLVTAFLSSGHRGGSDALEEYRREHGTYADAARLNVLRSLGLAKG